MREISWFPFCAGEGVNVWMVYASSRSGVGESCCVLWVVAFFCLFFFFFLVEMGMQILVVALSEWWVVIITVDSREVCLASLI